MERVFLSYTYNPHPDYEQVTEDLVRHVKILIDSLELQVVDGVDLGGRALDDEIKERIKKSDALVALVTPWRDPASGNTAPPPYVEDEYRFAEAHEKEAIRMIQDVLPVQGMYQQNEYIPFNPDREVDTLLKLMRTLALWKSRSGRPRQVEVAPTELGSRFDANAPGHNCEYQMLLNFQQTDWQKARIWYEPGATFAYLPRVPNESKIRLRLNLGNERWESPFTNLFGRIELARRGDR
ncbi:MAG: hypothetical protein ABFS02_07245 [Pseudomonadota bacterium]